jgi:hypothetical protein
MRLGPGALQGGRCLQVVLVAFSQALRHCGRAQQSYPPPPPKHGNKLPLTPRPLRPPATPPCAHTGGVSFTDRRSVKGNTLVVDEAADSSVFLEPMRWMADEVTGAVQGKLYCPGCSARLGSFNWAGGGPSALAGAVGAPSWGVCGRVWLVLLGLRGGCWALLAAAAVALRDGAG